MKIQNRGFEQHYAPIKIAGAMLTSLRRSFHAKRGKVGNKFGWEKNGGITLYFPAYRFGYVPRGPGRPFREPGLF